MRSSFRFGGLIVLSHELEVVIGINVHLHLVRDGDRRVLLVELLLEVIHVKRWTLALNLRFFGTVFGLCFFHLVKFGVFFVDFGLVRLNSN